LRLSSQQLRQHTQATGLHALVASQTKTETKQKHKQRRNRRSRIAAAPDKTVHAKSIHRPHYITHHHRNTNGLFLQLEARIPPEYSASALERTLCVLLNESTLIALKVDTNPNIKSACQEEHCPWDATAVIAWKLRAVSHMFLDNRSNRHENPFYEQQLILDFIE